MVEEEQEEGEDDDDDVSTIRDAILSTDSEDEQFIRTCHFWIQGVV